MIAEHPEHTVPRRPGGHHLSEGPEYRLCTPLIRVEPGEFGGSLRLKESTHRRFSDPQVVAAKQEKVDRAAEDGSYGFGDKIGADSNTEVNIGEEADAIAVEIGGQIG